MIEFGALVDSAPVMHLFAADQHLLLVVLVAGGLASGFIIALATAALFQRRSWSYLFVTLALATLLVRTVFGFLTVGGTVDGTVHHIMEHGLDVVTAILLIGAIYCARTVDSTGGRSV